MHNLLAGVVEGGGVTTDQGLNRRRREMALLDTDLLVLVVGVRRTPGHAVDGGLGEATKGAEVG